MKKQDLPTDTIAAQVQKARGKFSVLAGAYFLGAFNDNLFRGTLMLLAVSSQKGEIQGLATMVFMIPFMLFAAPAGWLADCYPKKNILVAAKSLELGIMLVGAVGLMTESWPLLLMMLGMMGLQSTLFNPALNGSIPELYPASFVPRANANIRILVNVAILLGLGLCGVVLDAWPKIGWWTEEHGPTRIGIAVVCIAFLGLLGAIFAPRLRTPDTSRPFPRLGPVNTVTDLRVIARTDKLLWIVIVCKATFWLIATLLTLFITPLGIKEMEISKTSTSGLLAALLIGMAVGGTLAPYWSRRQLWYRILPVPGLMMGAFLAPLPLLINLPDTWLFKTVFVLLIVVGAAGGAFLIPLASFVQTRPPRHAVGKTIAAANFLDAGGILIAGGIYWLLEGSVSSATGLAMAGLFACCLIPILHLMLKRVAPDSQA